MAVVPTEHSRQVRLALREIVTDHGPEALSRPAVLASMLADLMPDVPGVTRLLVAAAEDRLADELRDHVTQGMDIDTAARLTATSFAGNTLFTPETCAWVVGELAIALGMLPEAAGTSPYTTSPLAAAQRSAQPGPPGPVQAGVGEPTAPRPPSGGAPSGGEPSPAAVGPARPDDRTADQAWLEQQGLTLPGPASPASPAPTPASPAAMASRQRRWLRDWRTLTAGGLVVAAGIALAVTLGAAPSSALISLSGNKPVNSRLFLVNARTLTAQYSFTCTGDSGPTGNFIVVLETPHQSGPRSDYVLIANALSAGGARTLTVHPQDPGRRYYLSIFSYCTWSFVLKR